MVEQTNAKIDTGGNNFRWKILPATWQDFSAVRQLEKECFPVDHWPFWDIFGVLTLPDVVGSGTYTIQPADTLDEIATENNTTIETLISLNEDTYPSLRTEPWKLEIGWVLRLP